MDIRKADSTAITTRKRSNAAKSQQAQKYKAGTIMQASAEAMLPPQVAAKLSQISLHYALPLDMGKMNLNEATPQNLKAMRKIADMVSGNSKLLPEFMKLVAQVLNADIKLAEFHKNLTKAALKHQEKIDQETAEIFLAIARHGTKATKREHRTNVRNQLIERRTAAYERHYEDSVFGNESRIIDLEYEVAASNNTLLAESKSKHIAFNQQRKEKLQAYIDSAYTE